MKLEEFKNHLSAVNEVHFILENGQTVPAHFHITEVGLVTKHFIDCGGTVRTENNVNFQLWDANDIEHRLKPQKLKSIIHQSEKVLNLDNYEIEVEYQNQTIGKYNLDFRNGTFVLLNKQTSCLASDSCGIPPLKQKLKLSDITNNNSCVPGNGCCN